MKIYAFILGLGFLMLLSVSALAATPNFEETRPCQQVAMAMASEVAAGESTKAQLIHVSEVEKDISDVTYQVEVVGGRENKIQNVAATVRVFVREGVAYCDG